MRYLLLLFSLLVLVACGTPERAATPTTVAEPEATAQPERTERPQFLNSYASW